MCNEWKRHGVVMNINQTIVANGLVASMVVPAGK